MDTQTHWHPIALEDLLHSKPLLVIFGSSFSFYFSLEHRVSIEGKSHNKESYTVNSHWKSDVGACVKFWNSKSILSFSIFSIDVFYTIHFNMTSYILKYKRISKQQSR